jgi:hypothetical protein
MPDVPERDRGGRDRDEDHSGAEHSGLRRPLDADEYEDDDKDLIFPRSRDKDLIFPRSRDKDRIVGAPRGDKDLIFPRSRDKDRIVGAPGGDKERMISTRSQKTFEDLAARDSPPGVLSEYLRVLNEPMSDAEASDRIRRLKAEYEDWKRQTSGSERTKEDSAQVSPKSKLKK